MEGIFHPGLWNANADPSFVGMTALSRLSISELPVFSGQALVEGIFIRGYGMQTQIPPSSG
jgi:hypothetical protein